MLGVIDRLCCAIANTTNYIIIKMAVFPQFNVWPPTPPLPNAPRGLERLISLASYVHSHADGSAYVCQICSWSVQLFGIFPTFFNVWPPIPLQMPLGVRGVNLLAYVHSQNESAYVCLIWFQSDQLFGIIPIFFNLWPPNPPMPLRVSRG